MLDLARTKEAQEAPPELRVHDSSLAIEQVRLGDHPAVVRSAEDLPAVQQDNVGQLLILDELRDPVFRFVRHVDRDDAESSGAVFFMEGLEVRRLRTTEPSPDGPEAEQDDAAFVLRKRDALPGEAVEPKVRGRTSGTEPGRASDGGETRSSRAPQQRMMKYRFHLPKSINRDLPYGPCTTNVVGHFHRIPAFGAWSTDISQVSLRGSAAGPCRATVQAYSDSGTVPAGHGAS